MVKFTTSTPNKRVRLLADTTSRICSFCGEGHKSLVNTWDDSEGDWSQDDICLDCAKQVVGLLEPKKK